MDLAGRHVLVAGARRTGAAVADALVAAGARVTVADSDPVQLAALEPLLERGVRLELGIATPPPDISLVVTSPGWRPDAPLLVAAAAAGVEVVGEPELAWRLGAQAPGGAPVWLAVTGTNGKTTTVGMLASVLRAAGLDAVACGNVGLPVVTAVRRGHRVLAVELSSFQLHWSPSLRPAVGAVLNVAEDHLDWHGGMLAYTAAKARLLTGPVAVAGLDDAVAAALLAASPAPRRVGFTAGEPRPGQLGVVGDTLVDRAFPHPTGDALALAEVADVAPPGLPGLLDALAAAALARAYGVAPAAVRVGLRAFTPGAHRGAVVAEVGAVRFVDDSKATNPHAATASLAAHRRVVWVAGGLLKGAAVDTLVAEHAQRLAGAVLLGADRAELAAALARHAPKVPVVEVAAGDDGAMTEAVRTAAAMARAGDVVLLAPAAASTDMFSDYAHRGRAFADAARALAEHQGRR